MKTILICSTSKRKHRKLGRRESIFSCLIYLLYYFPHLLFHRFEFLQLPQLPLGQIGYPQAHDWIEHRKANIRPWSLFLNTANIRPPPNISRLSKRIVKNIEYFQSNYLFVFIGLVIYCL